MSQQNATINSKGQRWSWVHESESVEEAPNGVSYFFPNVQDLINGALLARQHVSSERSGPTLISHPSGGEKQLRAQRR